MLRITVHEKSGALTFQLEGELAGPWVRVMEECWQGDLARQHKPIIRVDLSEVTLIDAAGRACLAAMHRQGAEFVAADCLMKAIVAEITQQRTDLEMIVTLITKEHVELGIQVQSEGKGQSD